MEKIKAGAFTLSLLLLSACTQAPPAAPRAASMTPAPPPGYVLDAPAPQGEFRPLNEEDRIDAIERRADARAREAEHQANRRAAEAEVQANRRAAELVN